MREWLPANSSAAKVEGWRLSYGFNRAWRIHCESGWLTRDVGAWKVVLFGTEPHHAKARWLVQSSRHLDDGQDEWSSILAEFPSFREHPHLVAEAVAAALLR